MVHFSKFAISVILTFVMKRSVSIGDSDVTAELGRNKRAVEENSTLGCLFEKISEAEQWLSTNTLSYPFCSLCPDQAKLSNGVCTARNMADLTLHWGSICRFDKNDMTDLANVSSSLFEKVSMVVLHGLYKLVEQQKYLNGTMEELCVLERPMLADERVLLMTDFRAVFDQNQTTAVDVATGIESALLAANGNLGHVGITNITLEDINECAMGVDTCNASNLDCSNTYGSYICNCTDGYSISSNYTHFADQNETVCIPICNAWVKLGSVCPSNWLWLLLLIPLILLILFLIFIYLWFCGSKYKDGASQTDIDVDYENFSESEKRLSATQTVTSALDGQVENGDERNQLSSNQGSRPLDDDLFENTEPRGQILIDSVKQPFPEQPAAPSVVETNMELGSLIDRDEDAIVEEINSTEQDSKSQFLSPVAAERLQLDDLLPDDNDEHDSFQLPDELPDELPVKSGRNSDFMLPKISEEPLLDLTSSIGWPTQFPISETSSKRKNKPAKKINKKKLPMVTEDSVNFGEESGAKRRGPLLNDTFVIEKAKAKRKGLQRSRSLIDMGKTSSEKPLMRRRKSIGDMRKISANGSLPFKPKKKSTGKKAVRRGGQADSKPYEWRYWPKVPRSFQEKPGFIDDDLLET